MATQHIDLVIENVETGIWGSVNFNDSLIIERADNLIELEANIKALLKDFEDVDPEGVVFKIRHTTDAD